MSYSQNDEEQHILAAFTGRAPGRFLDIGAHDGVIFSNTRALAELGWFGTLVEPSPAPFVKLMDNYWGRNGMNLAHVAIVPERSRMLALADSRGDFVSTFDKSHERLWAAPGADGREGVKFQEIFVYGITFAELFRTFPGPYQFVNLDVEGINVELFRELPLREIGAEFVCVEYQDRLSAIEAHAAAQGFKRVHLTSENVLLARV